MSGLHLVGAGDESGIPQVELRDIEALLPYAGNARTHNAAQVTSIANSLQEWGWTNAVLIDGAGGMVAGHGRVMAASELYKQGKAIRFANGAPIPPGKVPVIVCDGWTDQQKKSYILADNQLAMLAGWDVELLKVEVDELEEGGFDMEMAGFSDELLAEMFAGLEEPKPEGSGDPDDAPEAPEQPVSERGDVWVLGPHRVCCGSSTEGADWDRLMLGEMADACFIDPPYNVDIGLKNRKLDRADGLNRAATGAIANDKMSPAEFREFMLALYQEVIGVMKSGAPIYVAHSDKESHTFRTAFEEAGFKFSSCIIWKKNTMVLGMGDYQPIHEPILYGWKPGSKHRWYGGRKNTSVIDMAEGGPFTRMEDGRFQIRIGDAVMVVSGEATVEEYPSSIIYEPKPAKSGLHPTQKPVALVERLLRTSARTGDIVIDGCGGSGTTLVAADRMGMCARLMEVDPRFVDVIVRRWEMLTGRRAAHAVTGEPFPADGEARAPRQAEPEPDLESPDCF
ncbi:site-specific DNA-methyltransferase [Tardiphaga sp. 862_B3_N1_1]|uniref:site-specific DNA-methyltransferase n=1 Tax=Tardiphaga sp. 862_B3_N1_1 TaxID=3240763 RepID=UPI003F8BFE41